MATLEGPVMSIRQVNALSHYTDWTIGHVHSGALGWNAFITFGALYYLVPVLWNRQRLYSIRLVSYHYWIATIGILLYIPAMWEIGRASCRERVCQSVSITVVAGSLKKKQSNKHTVTKT